MSVLPRAQHLGATLPAELLALPQWLPWLPLPRGNGRLGKAPALPARGNLRPVDCRQEGVPWEAALTLAREHRAGGVGVVLTAGCGLVAVDLDAPLSPETQQRLDGVPGYAEVSPSGTGVHLWLCGDLRQSHRQQGQEWLSRGYVTVTAVPLPGRSRAPGALSQAQAVFGVQATSQEFPVRGGPTSLAGSDTAVLERLARARNGERALRLLAGEWAALGYASASQGDFAAARVVRFYSGDPEQIARILRASGLRRDKWERDDYLQRTIARATALGGPQWQRVSPR